MAEPERREPRGPDRTAEQVRRGDRDNAPERAAGDQPAAAYAQPEAQLGGADAVEKTTYVVGEGTDPDRRTRGPYVARGAAGGSNLAVWLIAGVAALIALVYAVGLFR